MYMYVRERWRCKMLRTCVAGSRQGALTLYKWCKAQYWNILNNQSLVNNKFHESDRNNRIYIHMLGKKQIRYSSSWAFYIMSVHIQCQAFIYYTLSLCRGHSWRVRLAKQETLTPPGHLVSPLVCRVRECPPWCSIVCATVTVHQFFCIFIYCNI